MIELNQIGILIVFRQHKGGIMDKNLLIAENVLKHVGGSENIDSVFHCATRLRFVLLDESKIDDDEIKNIDGVFGTMNAGGMYQIIIGQNVEKVYERLCEIGNFKKEKMLDEEDSKGVIAEHKDKTVKKIANNVLSYVVASMTPVIYPLLGAALWNTFGLILGPNVLNILSAESGFYVSTQILYSAFFYYLPIYVGYSAAKALKISNPIWGMLIGGLILSPNFVSLLENNTTLSLFSFINVPIADYGQSLLPVLIGVWLFSYIYKILSKVIPSILFGTIAPIIIYFVMAIIMFLVAAPLGTYIGEGITNIFMAMGNSILPIRLLAFALLTALWPMLTLFGMHLPIALTAMGLMATSGQDTFVLVCSTSSVFYLYGMALGAFLKFKKKENKATAFSAFISGFIGAICEPILYGICLKSKSSIRAMLIGGAILGIIIAVFQPVYYNIGVGNIFAVFGVYAGGGSANLIIGVGISLFAVILGLVAVILFAKYDEGENDAPKN